MKKIILSLAVATLSVMAAQQPQNQNNEELKKAFSKEWAAMSAELEKQKIQNQQQATGVPQQLDTPQNKANEAAGKNMLLEQEYQLQLKEEKKAMLKALPKNSTYEVVPDYIVVGGKTTFYIKKSEFEKAKKFFLQIKTMKSNTFQTGTQFGATEQAYTNGMEQQKSFKVEETPLQINKGMDFGYFLVSVLEKDRLVFKEK